MEMVPNIHSIEVLLVDANPLNVLTGAAVLEDGGCRTDVCSNGLDAVKATCLKRYDLILMDCMTEDVDGCETAEAIRSDAASLNVKTPIVALTSETSQECRDRCYAAGMVDFILKPLRIADLSEKIESWFEWGKAECPFSDCCKESVPAVFNEAFLLSIFDDDPDCVSELAGAFKKTLVTYYRALQGAIESSADWPELRSCSSLLKDSSQAMGGERLGAALESMEAACIEENISAFDSFARIIDSEYSSLVDILEQRELGCVASSLMKDTEEEHRLML